MSWPGNQPDNYMSPNNFARSPPTTPGSGQPPPPTFEIPYRQTAGYVSSPPTLQGRDYMQSPRPESFQTGYSYKKEVDQNRGYPARAHHFWRQLFRLLGAGFVRFLISAVLIICLWQIIWTYGAFNILNQDQKRFFNFLVTAFSLALGLNLASSLKRVAIKGRWWILSWEKRPLDEVEAILGCHALTQVIKLGWESMPKKPSITIGCALWLLINLATQTFVAVIGLNYSIHSAVDSSSSIPGGVLYTNLTEFYFKGGEDSISADQLIAHEYGDLAINYKYQNFSDVPGRIPAIPPLTLYSAGNYTDIWDFDTYSQYIFLDSPVDSASTVGLFYSNRSITTEASCTSKAEQVIPGQNNTVTMGYNELPEYSVTYYVTPNADGTPESCGPRCTKVYALENNGIQGFSYDCNVTVGSVVNASSIRSAQEVSDDIAAIAAQSIAVNGYGGSKAASKVQGFSFYNDVVWGYYYSDGDPSWKAYLLRIHAIGAIVGADKYSPFVPDGMPGLIPNQGVRLNIDNPNYILAILWGIGGFHFVFFILAAWLSNKVVVIDDSYLVIAMLMRPIVNRIDHGSLMSGKEIYEALKRPEVTYGTVDRNAVDKNALTVKIKHLEISEMSGKPSNGWTGWYD